MKLYKLFIYGSLKRGFSNHAVLEGAKFIKDYTTSYKYTLLNLGAFPGLYQSGVTPISGEIWEVNERKLAQLDWFEGHPNLFERRLMKGELEGEEDLWCYFFNSTSFGAPTILNGIWIERDIS